MRGLFLRFLKKRIKAKSLEEFASLVRKRGGATIDIQPLRKNTVLSSRSARRGAGIHRYGTEFSCLLPSGKRIEYAEWHFEQTHTGKILERSKTKAEAENRYGDILAKRWRKLKRLLSATEAELSPETIKPLDSSPTANAA